MNAPNPNMLPGILRFRPIFRSVRWGGTRLGAFKGIDRLPSDKVGESWEISGLEGYESVVEGGRLDGMTISQVLDAYGDAVLGPRLHRRFGSFFPLLVKFIDADDDLSIQVHPDNDKAPGGLGKTELWYILHADPGSYIYSGFNRPMTPERLRRCMDENRLVNVLAKHFATHGDVFYIPAGRVHSIGAGNLLLEIQQTSGITYRLHDYGRKDSDGRTRELHVEQAFDVIDFGQTDFGLARPQMLIDCETRIKITPFFTVTAVQIMSSLTIESASIDSPRIIIAIEGSGTVTDPQGNTTVINRGQTVLVPAYMQHIDIRATSTPLKLISVFIE